MFTGIIQAVGKVRKIGRKGADALLEIEAPLDMTDVRNGDSIAVNGVCLTVTFKSAGGFAADVSAETISRSSFSSIRNGDPVNLEKALRMTDFLGGHLVLGHVDGLGKISEIVNRSASLVFGIDVDSELGMYIVEKGSIAVDGVSLTVNKYENERFFINVIPHTAHMTTLAAKKPGDALNIETDIIGKYVKKFMNPKKVAKSSIDEGFLAKYGFIR